MLGDVSPKLSPEEFTTGSLEGNYNKNRNKNVYPGMLYTKNQKLIQVFTFPIWHLSIFFLCLNYRTNPTDNFNRNKLFKHFVIFYNFLAESDRVTLQYVLGVENSEYINAVFVQVHHD